MCRLIQGCRCESVDDKIDAPNVYSRFMQKLARMNLCKEEENRVSEIVRLELFKNEPANISDEVRSILQECIEEVIKEKQLKTGSKKKTK